MAIAADRAAMSMKLGGSSSEVKDWSSYTPVRVRNMEEMAVAAKRRDAKKTSKKIASALRGGAGGGAGKPYIAPARLGDHAHATGPEHASSSSPSSERRSQAGHQSPSSSSGAKHAKAWSSADAAAASAGGAGRPEAQNAASSADAALPSLDGMDSSIFDAAPSNGKDAAGGSAEHWKAIARRLKYELTTCQRRSASEIALREQDVRRHQTEAEGLREENEKLTLKLSEMMRAMDELRREGEAELAKYGRENAVASKRAAIVERKLAGHEEDLEKRLRAAALREESLKKERDALACGLAAVAESAVGGKGATPAVLLKEAEAAIAEGADPLPKKRDAWVKFIYSNQISASAGDGLALRKLGCDGDRAVSSLVSCVDRLHRRRKEAIRSEMEALGQIESLHVVIERVEREYEGVRSALDALEGAAGRIVDHKQTGAHGKRGARMGLAARARGMADALAKVESRLRKGDTNAQKLKARVLELEFYGKLHEYIVDEAKSLVGGGGGGAPQAAGSASAAQGKEKGGAAAAAANGGVPVTSSAVPAPSFQQ